MGLFRKKKRTSRRATRKAEAKALKHKAGLEAKLAAKNDRRRHKSSLRAEKKASRREKKARHDSEKNQLKIAEAQQAAAEAGKLNAKKVTRYLSVVRVLAPVAVPVIYRGATALRGQLDRYRAERLGVQVEQLGQFTGHGAHLNARISGAEQSVAAVVTENPNDAETQQFATAMRERLTNLSTAVGAAEHMPAARRRAAHAAIARELDGVEADVLARLGVR